MPRVAEIALRVLVVLLALGFVGYRYLLGRTAVPEQSSYALDLTEIRRLAASLPGERPLRVNHEQIAEAPLPRGAIFAGESLRTPHPMSHGAHQLVFSDGYLVIDSGFDEAGLREMSPGAVLAQFRTLHDLAAREPVQLVVSHDVDQRRELIASGKLGAHFEF